jgi:hypothetical protein
MDEVASVDTSAFSTIEDTLLNLLELIPINLKFIYFYILKKNLKNNFFLRFQKYTISIGARSPRAQKYYETRHNSHTQILYACMTHLAHHVEPK